MTYATSYFDAAGRDIADVDLGTNGGASYTRPADVPAASDTVLVTATAYNAAGLAATVTDPLGRQHPDRLRHARRSDGRHRCRQFDHLVYLRRLRATC